MITQNYGSLFRVVAVDDHKEYLKPLAWFLQQIPDLHLVGLAHDGPTGIEIVRETRPDVVLMDLSLGPEMNGVEATRRILEEYPQIRILAYTGYGDPEMLIQALQAGVSGYYLKGAGEFEDLVDAIRKVAKGESVFMGNGIPQLKPLSDLETDAYDWESLAPNESRILELAARGISSAKISGLLGIKETTCGNYRRAIREKLGLEEWHQAVLAYAYRML